MSLTPQQLAQVEQSTVVLSQNIARLLDGIDAIDRLALVEGMTDEARACLARARELVERQVHAGTNHLIEGARMLILHDAQVEEKAKAAADVLSLQQKETQADGEGENPG